MKKAHTGSDFDSFLREDGLSACFALMNQKVATRR
jgi:hypothetical protein